MDHDDDLPAWQRPFNDAYRLLDLDSRPQSQTAQQVTCVEKALALAPGMDVLDIACATGRHATALAARGYRVTGIDLNEDYLARARQRAAQAGVCIRTVTADMRQLSRLGAGRFDAAIVMYSSFGYFPDPTDNLSVLTGIRRVLKPGGRALLDIINRDWFIRNYRSSDYVPANGTFVTRDYQVTGERVLLHENTFRPRESRLCWSIREAASLRPLFSLDYRMYSAHEVVDLASAAGLRVTDILGDYECRPFSVLSPRILCVMASE